MENIQKEIKKVKELLLQSNLQNKGFLTLEEASCYLQVSKSALYKLTSSNEITHYKPNGKLIYFKKTDLDDWISKGKVSSIDEIEVETQAYLSRTSNTSKS